MDLTDASLWTLVEEAVIADRGEDEERMLAQMVRSYLARRGLSDTLVAFDEEYMHGDEAAAAPMPRNETESCAHPASPSVGGLRAATLPVLSSDETDTQLAKGIERRRVAQLLCLQRQYEAVAALMEPRSLARIRLLCIQAQSLPDVSAAVFYLANHVAALIPLCMDPTAGHWVYTVALSNVLSPCREQPRIDAEEIAREVNDELCGAEQRSSLHVLFNWAYWQETSLP